MIRPVNPSALSGAAMPDSHDDVHVAGAWNIAKKIWSHRGDTATAGFFLRNVTKPWLAPTSYRSATDSISRTKSIFGGSRESDGSDAFRHTFASALMTMRIRERGVDATTASQLVTQLGEAHERDTPHRDDPLTKLESQMDLHNNAVGISLVPIASDRHQLPSPEYLTSAVLQATKAGKLIVFEGKDTLRASGPGDLPQ